MQNADDLDVVGTPAVKDKIRRFDQHARIRCDVGPGRTGLRKILQNIEARLNTIILPIGCGWIVSGNPAPDIQKIAARTGG